ncbi:MAG: hypothetical protein QOH36_1363 [Actinomycetota bacterium]|jgi:glycosyltransferase involved in cell wall biosynthesis|nr:hypothetical protein [Actinomycetota bacterium]MEA2973379.1 hypothetical protein [Actinomycetota bacterium]
MATIGLVAPPSRHGLGTSADLVARVLGDAGHDVRRHVTDEPPPAQARFDLVILMEVLVEHWLGVGAPTALIPNPEWFLDEFVGLLDGVDVVFAKTHDAVAAFEALGCQVEFTRFTSRDRWLPAVGRDPRSFLHVAGKSHQKGTNTLVDVWAANRDFPRLTIVRTRPRLSRRRMPRHVTLLDEYLPDGWLQVLQNRAAVHVCPSEAEGWGHHIVEGLSVGAVVVTTDAPPMNEILRPDRGILCAYRSSAQQRLGTAYQVDPDALAAAVRATLERDPAELARLGRRARSFFLENDADFRQRLVAAVNRLVPSGSQSG